MRYTPAVVHDAMVPQIIGIDCSARPANVGMARAIRRAGRWVLDEVCTGGRERAPAAVVADWILDGPTPVLLALDAPLGWPKPMRQALAAHRAGAALTQSADDLFRRETDRVVRERIGNQSFDVGADRIARTAHWSLRFLADLRKRTGEPVPLAWTGDIAGVAAAIEVYPAATLLAHGIAIRGYKDLSNRPIRESRSRPRGAGTVHGPRRP